MLASFKQGVRDEAAQVAKAAGDYNNGHGVQQFKMVQLLDSELRRRDGAATQF